MKKCLLKKLLNPEQNEKGVSFQQGLVPFHQLNHKPWNKVHHPSQSGHDKILLRPHVSHIDVRKDHIELHFLS
jgi:hypothetical protein